MNLSWHKRSMLWWHPIYEGGKHRSRSSVQIVKWKNVVCALLRSCLKFSCQRFLYRVKCLKETFEAVQEISLLVKKSPKGNKKLDEILNHSKNDANFIKTVTILKQRHIWITSFHSIFKLLPSCSMTLF